MIWILTFNKFEECKALQLNSLIHIWTHYYPIWQLPFCGVHVSRMKFHIHSSLVAHKLIPNFNIQLTYWLQKPNENGTVKTGPKTVNAGRVGVWSLEFADRVYVTLWPLSTGSRFLWYEPLIEIITVQSLWDIIIRNSSMNRDLNQYLPVSNGY